MLGLAIKINLLKTKTSIIGYEFETTNVVQLSTLFFIRFNKIWQGSECLIEYTSIIDIQDSEPHSVWHHPFKQNLI